MTRDNCLVSQGFFNFFFKKLSKGILLFFFFVHKGTFANY